MFLSKCQYLISFVVVADLWWIRNAERKTGSS